MIIYTIYQNKFSDLLFFIKAIILFNYRFVNLFFISNMRWKFDVHYFDLWDNFSETRKSKVSSKVGIY